MFKNLLVVLEDRPEPVGAYAISLAKRLEARVTIIRPRRDGLGFADGSVEARLDAARGDAESRKAQATAAVQNFAKAAITAGVDVEALFPDGGADPRREQVAAFARAFDFTIVGQSEPGRPPQHDDLVGLLLERQRPSRTRGAGHSAQRRSVRRRRRRMGWQRRRRARVRRRDAPAQARRKGGDRFDRVRPHAAGGCADGRAARGAARKEQRQRRLPSRADATMTSPTRCCPTSPI